MKLSSRFLLDSLFVVAGAFLTVASMAWSAGTAGWWTRLAAFVQRHPAPLAAAAAAVMLVLAIPVLSLRLGSSDAANDPAATTTPAAS